MKPEWLRRREEAKRGHVKGMDMGTELKDMTEESQTRAENKHYACLRLPYQVRLQDFPGYSVYWVGICLQSCGLVFSIIIRRCG